MDKVEKNKWYAVEMAKGQLSAYPKDRAHLGCCIVKGKERRLTMNKMAKTHPDSARWHDGEWIAKGIHAEQYALIAGRTFSQGAILYVARILKDGSLALAVPCDVCRELLYAAGVKKVHYSIGPEEWGVLNVSEWNQAISWSR